MTNCSLHLCSESHLLLVSQGHYSYWYPQFPLLHQVHITATLLSNTIHSLVYQIMLSKFFFNSQSHIPLHPSSGQNASKAFATVSVSRSSPLIQFVTHLFIIQPYHFMEFVKVTNGVYFLNPVDISLYLCYSIYLQLPAHLTHIDFLTPFWLP
jgi:hypothetical protein